MEAQARPVNVQKPGRLAEDIARLCTEKQSDTFDDTDFAEVSGSSSIPAAEESAGDTGSSASSNGGIPEAQRAKQHEAELATSYQDFRCNCGRAVPKDKAVKRFQAFAACGRGMEPAAHSIPCCSSLARVDPRCGWSG